MRTNSLSLGLAGLTLAALAFGVAPARAENVAYKAVLSSASEVPPNASKGMGNLDATYDTATMKLTWKLTYSDLSGSSTGTHFHGPAEAGKNAGIAVAIPGSGPTLEGSAVLSTAQAADLQAGKWYVNVHTAANKDGEIRGQVVKSK